MKKTYSNPESVLVAFHSEPIMETSNPTVTNAKGSKVWYSDHTDLDNEWEDTEEE